MGMHVCYLDCHEAAPYCYLMIYIENLVSITAILLPSVTYLLTLPCIIPLFLCSKSFHLI
jgi:hypothetical protein